MIELMAVVTMIIIVTGVVFANYGTGQESMALERSSQKLYQDLRFAVSNAMSGIEGNYGNGIHFDITTDESKKKYHIFKNSVNNAHVFNASSSGSTNIFPSKTNDIADWVKLEDGVKILYLRDAVGTSQTTLDIFFRSPYPTVFLNGNNNYYQNSTDCAPRAECTVVIMLSTNDETRTKTITINNAGMINLN